MLITYVDDSGTRHRTDISTSGEIVAFIAAHPEYSDFAIIRLGNSRYRYGRTISAPWWSKKARLAARAEALFHNKKFTEVLHSNPIKIYPEGSKEVFTPFNMAVFNILYPYNTPWYSWSDSLKCLSDEEVREKAAEDAQAYREAVKNGREIKDVVRVRDLSNPGAAEDAAQLLPCTPDFWGRTANEASRGPSLEMLYLKYVSYGLINETVNGDSKRYSGVTYINTDESLPFNITGWNIRLVLLNLKGFVFKPFNAVAGGKVLTLAPVIPAFTEEQAKRILKKRLCQSSAVVLDGKVFFFQGLCSDFDDRYPYDEFSLEKGLGLKFEKLPEIETLEIERTFDGVELQHFFRLPFCRSLESLVFTDDTCSEFVAHPALDESNASTEYLPGHCYKISQTDQVYYPYMNFLFMHMFAEELGLKPVVDAAMYSKYEILPLPFMKKVTAGEVAEKRIKEETERLEKYCSLLVEIGEKDIKAETARLEIEKENWVNGLLKDAELIESSEDLSEFALKDYSEALKRYVPLLGLDTLNLTRNSSAYKRVLEFFLYSSEEHNGCCADLSALPNFYLLKALAYFYFKGPLSVRGAENIDRHPEKTTTLDMEKLDRERFCYLMSFLNPIFGITPVETDGYVRIRKNGGYLSAAWVRNCGMDKFINSLTPDAEACLDFFTLHFRDTRFTEFFENSNLNWIREIDKKDGLLSAEFKSSLLRNRRRTALFYIHENSTGETKAMIKKLRKRCGAKTKSFESVLKNHAAKHEGKDDLYIYVWDGLNLVKAWDVEQLLKSNEINWIQCMKDLGFSGFEFAEGYYRCPDLFLSVFSDWKTL